jgi:MacB-like periplasmic core domain
MLRVKIGEPSGAMPISVQTPPSTALRRSIRLVMVSIWLSANRKRRPTVTQGEDGNFSLFSWEGYKNFREHTPEFMDLAALQAGNAPLGVRRAGSQAAADTRNGEWVSGNFFRTLGVQPWIGRLMTDTDDREGAPSVAVMSYRIWKEKYGSDPSVVGAGYQINGHPFTVIGVAPPGFYGAKLAGGGMPDFWLPLTTELIIDGETARLKRPNTNFLDVIGRVRPGVNPKTLEAKLRVEFHDWLASHVPDMEPGEKQLWQQQTLHLIPGGAGVAAMRDQYQDGAFSQVGIGLMLGIPAAIGAGKLMTGQLFGVKPWDPIMLSVPGFPTSQLSPVPLMWFSSKRTTCSCSKPQPSTGNPGKPTCPGVPWRDLRCAIRVPHLPFYNHFPFVILKSL